MTSPSPVAKEIAARAQDLALSREEMIRFSRHLLLPEVGVAGQERLKAARVLIIGAGGLGSPVSLYLAAAGIGTIGLIDFDVVERSNLQRQILYRDQDAGRLKVDAARERLLSLAPDLALSIYTERLSATNALSIFRDYDVIVDGTDNFPTRYLANDACVMLGKPLVYGSIFRFDGQTSVFAPPEGPCYRCLFPEPPPPGQTPNCAEGGVLGVLPGQIGIIQATETLKLILGVGAPLIGRLLVFDALAMRFDEFKLRKDPTCPVCGEEPRIKTLEETVQSCEVKEPGMRPLQADESIDVQTYVRMRESGTDHLLLDVRAQSEADVCRIEGSTLIPLPELPSRLDDLPRDKPIVCHCKGGGRSARAVLLLKANGFQDVHNLEGGILAWIDQVDPSLARY